MLDAKFVRENLDAVAEAMANRNFTAWDSQAFTELDAKRRELIQEVESLQAQRNSSSKEIGKLMGAGEKELAEAKKAEVKEINDGIASANAELGKVQDALRVVLISAPNLPDATVPVGKDETENVEVRRWGTPREFDFDYKAHWDLGPELGMIDFDRAVKLSGSRFVVLGGLGARLERSIINFMADTHTSRGYTEWWLPAMANARTMTGTGQLPKFENDMFKTFATDMEGTSDKEGDNLYLIPTAEVQLTNLHAGETLGVDELPKHYCAFTPCFREEAGSAGRDTRGLIRVHQFDKVEMVKVCEPEKSFDELEAMVADAENILQLLGLPYRVITLCTGDMGFSAAKTYDLEVWLPCYNDYKEISSCSNCTDFQARRMNMRYKDPEHFKGTRYVHTLNGSGLAVGRTMAAIIENYQQADGSIKVPDVLVPYMGGVEVIEPE